MKILFTDRYFWPDATSYGANLRSIAEALASEGHQVHVFSSRPSYRSRSAQAVGDDPTTIRIRRCFVFQEHGAHMVVRLVNLVLYCSALFMNVLRTRADVVVAATNPPVLAAWTASVAARWSGARFIYHLQDIHPEVVELSDWGFGRWIPTRFLRWLDNQTLRRSAAIVTLSDDMAETVRARGLGNLPIHVINNFANDDFGEKGAPPPEELRKAPGRRRVIFAGNLGRFQNLPKLTEGIALCLERHPDLELFFLGDGAAATELKQRWGNHEQIVFAPFLPYVTARELIREADIGLLSLSKGMYRLAYPSKLLTYLALGLPVLAVIEADSALSRLLVEERLGSVPKDDSPESIAEALESLLADPMPRTHVADWYNSNASAEAVVARWKKLCAKLVP